jgi:hypothetical protein
MIEEVRDLLAEAIGLGRTSVMLTFYVDKDHPLVATEVILPLRAAAKKEESREQNPVDEAHLSLREQDSYHLLGKG